MFQFLIDINHRKYGGWNKFEKQAQTDVQAELGKALAQFLVENYETINISFKVSLSFSSRDTAPKFTPITRLEKRLFVSGGMEIDWRNKVEADAAEIKEFIAQAAVVVVKEGLQKLDVSLTNFDQALVNLSQATGVSYDKPIAVSFVSSGDDADGKQEDLLMNKLAINIALIDDHQGDAADAQLGASICQELEKLASEKNFVLVSTACGNGFFSIEINTPDPIGLGDELVPWLRMMKLKDGSMINAYFKNGKFMELKRADIGRSASEDEPSSKLN